ncbi:MAG TPA: ribonuclease domain-containing protein [Actinophytocola sp.]|jgi:guanyl-specific ribonuclease Sa|uniref:ribonuclease domain-containing protein n=1 Tax=Actinophytocola sp. TaxID=1872138 RepID=UPI002F95C990
MSNGAPKSVKTLLTVLIAVLGVFGVSTATFAATSATDTTATALAQPPCGDTSGYDVVKLADLPPEAADTEDLIASGGPFPYPQDGTVFDNREGILPDCDSGYYHEYTVKTPGSPDRGARRIVTGQGGEHFYTGDHYETFSLIDLGGSGGNDCGTPTGIDQAPLSSLPAEVADTVELVRAGGPYPYPEDGTVYENREGVLPACPAAYYHLYTVPTPGAPDRGERRLITGANGEFFYTPDRYASFVLVDVNA